MWNLNNIRIRIVDIKEQPGYGRIIIRHLKYRGEGIQILFRGKIEKSKAVLDEWVKNEEKDKEMKKLTYQCTNLNCKKTVTYNWSYPVIIKDLLCKDCNCQLILRKNEDIKEEPSKK